MKKELQVASRVICKRLRKRPYQKGVSITAWQAIIEQILDGRRSGAFSWHKSLGDEVQRYIQEMDTDTKMAIWNSSGDAEVVPNAHIDTITECLYPHVFHSALPAIHRAVRRRERIEGRTTKRSTQRLPAVTPPANLPEDLPAGGAPSGSRESP